MASDELVLSHFSIRHADFVQRARAATAAGYVGIGLYLREYERLRADGRTDAQLRATLEEHGQRVVEFEALRGWASSGAAHATCLRHLDVIDAMAEALGPAHHVQVIGPYEGTVDDAAEGFAMACDRLAQHGMRAALEYFPEMSNIPNVEAAWQIVQLAGRDNGGLCVDSWHHFRTGDTFEELARIPGDRIVGVQINDGPQQRTVADYYTDCTSYRLVPGDGDFDLVGFVRTLDAAGVDVPFEVEVISLELDRLPVTESARLMADGTRAVLAAARSSTDS
jgi:sugar phosphate isomerase/epimerase